MRKSYYGPNATHAPEDAGACDAACRASCLPLLDDTWSARLSGRTCPARDVLLRCLLVRYLQGGACGCQCLGRAQQAAETGAR